MSLAVYAPEAFIALEAQPISWDLPERVSYTPNSELVANCRVVNTLAETRIFAIVARYTDADGVIINEFIVTFKTPSGEIFNAFELAPMHGFSFTLTVSISITNVYFGLSLYTLKEVGGELHLDSKVGEVKTLLREPPSAIEAMIPMMMLMMVMGMIMPMMTTMMPGVSKKAPETKPTVVLLPPGKE